MKKASLVLWISLLGWAGLGTALAQSVVLSGVLGNKALLVIDGGAPKGVAVGETHRGVKVLALQKDLVDVEVEGKRQTIRLGEGPMGLGSNDSGSEASRRIVLHAGTNGHFRSTGQINGQSVNFMVDTGASAVSLSIADAQRIGLKYQNGSPIYLNTANGVSQGYLVKLDRVRVGSVEIYGVDAVVSPASMPFVLLGNSFLNRFQMTRINDEMVLEQRY